jgi:hypothetical protein
MTLQDVIRAVDRLSSEERRELREYLEQRESTERVAQELSPQERARRLREGFAKLREGLSEAELDEIIEAMNAEYIEPVDESQWKD